MRGGERSGGKFALVLQSVQEPAPRRRHLEHAQDLGRLRKRRRATERFMGFSERRLQGAWCFFSL